jgi:CRISPR-associated protein Cmr1
MPQDYTEEGGQGRRVVPAAPKLDELPPRLARQHRAGPIAEELNVGIEVVTPIFGGGVRPRELDDVDVIRAATVRGHLRFWWRALYAHECASPKALYHREGELWGRASGESGGRSLVDIQIHDFHVQHEKDTGPIRPNTSQGYVLWVANTPLASRRNGGTRFRVTCRAPDRMNEVQGALRAWILFGGYGGRTRRGVGSLTVVGDQPDWQPQTASAAEFKRVFGRDVFSRNGQTVTDVPSLAGASLVAGASPGSVVASWETAIQWLRDFRRSQPRRDRGELGIVDAAKRVASPLIVKALPIANGKFVPCALWLRRAGTSQSLTPAGGSSAQERLRREFMKWMRSRAGRIEVIAP